MIPLNETSQFFENKLHLTKSHGKAWARQKRLGVPKARLSSCDDFEGENDLGLLDGAYLESEEFKRVRGVVEREISHISLVCCF